MTSKCVAGNRVGLHHSPIRGGSDSRPLANQKLMAAKKFSAGSNPLSWVSSSADAVVIARSGGTARETLASKLFNCPFMAGPEERMRIGQRRDEQTLLFALVPCRDRHWLLIRGPPNCFDSKCGSQRIDVVGSTCFVDLSSQEYSISACRSGCTQEQDIRRG